MRTAKVKVKLCICICSKLQYCQHLANTFNTICFLNPHTIVAAIAFVFLQSFPGNVVNEDEADIILPIMVNIIPSDSSLPFDVVVRFSVAGGTATSKDTYILHRYSYNLYSMGRLEHLSYS